MLTGVSSSPHARIHTIIQVDTGDQPVPAQFKHKSFAPRRPPPAHDLHGCTGCRMERLPFPPHTRHEMTRLAEVADRPVPSHHAHFSGA